MPIAKPKEAAITVVMAAFILLAVAGLSIPPVLAASGSIARVDYYPQDQGTYESVNYFLMQIASVNTNTTVSVSIDGGLPIPITCQGLKSAIVPGDTVPYDWYTWQTTVQLSQLKEDARSSSSATTMFGKNRINTGQNSVHTQRFTHSS
jgi:hypothetical protein